MAAASGVVAVLAVKATKDANKIAKAANDMAEDALRQAQEANGIAVDANELARDANSIAERALLVAQSDTPYHWVLKVEDDGTAVVVNDCGHRADKVTVIIDVDGNVIDQTGPTDVPAFEQLDFDLSGTVQQHLEHVRMNPGRKPIDAGSAFVAGSSGRPVETVFRATLTWFTAEQVPRRDVVEEVMRHVMTPSGTLRRSKRRQRDT